MAPASLICVWMLLSPVARAPTQRSTLGKKASSFSLRSVRRTGGCDGSGGSATGAVPEAAAVAAAAAVVAAAAAAPSEPAPPAEAAEAVEAAEAAETADAAAEAADAADAAEGAAEAAEAVEALASPPSASLARTWTRWARIATSGWMPRASRMSSWPRRELRARTHIISTASGAAASWQQTPGGSRKGMSASTMSSRMARAFDCEPRASSSSASSASIRTGGSTSPELGIPLTMATRGARAPASRTESCCPKPLLAHSFIECAKSLTASAGDDCGMARRTELSAGSSHESVQG